MSNEKIREFETTVVIRLNPKDVAYFGALRAVYADKVKDVPFDEFLNMCLRARLSQHMRENAGAIAGGGLII